MFVTRDSYNGGRFSTRAGILDTRTDALVPTLEDWPVTVADRHPDRVQGRARRQPRHGWRLSVLNLATGRVTPLAEEHSVDDQAVWLDSAAVYKSCTAVRAAETKARTDSQKGS